jgi:hypothetical protein
MSLSGGHSVTSHPHRDHSHAHSRGHISGQAPRFLSLQNISTSTDQQRITALQTFTVAHLVKNFAFFYGTQRFITVFIKYRQSSLSWNSWINVSMIRFNIIIHSTLSFKQYVHIVALYFVCIIMYDCSFFPFCGKADGQKIGTANCLEQSTSDADSRSASQ